MLFHFGVFLGRGREERGLFVGRFFAIQSFVLLGVACNRTFGVNQIIYFVPNLFFPNLLFSEFSEVFLGIFRSSRLSSNPVRFVGGICCHVPCEHFPCDPPQNRLGFGSNLKLFPLPRVLGVLRFDSRFLMIESDLGLDLRARGCP